jgi:hypothetical protein
MIMASCRFLGENPTKWVFILTSLRRLVRLSVVVDRAMENVQRWGLRG